MANTKQRDHLSITGVILAGGKGTRFGGNKALIRINGQPLIEWIIERYQGIFDEILISANDPSSYELTGIKTVKDMVPHKGPLMGIYSCLKESAHEQIFVSACDMPFIRIPLVNHMVRQSEGYDVVVPCIGENKLEPLHAIYRKSCLPAMERSIESGHKRVISFFPDVRVYTMEKEELLRHDPELYSFFNINTRKDLKKAREIFYALEI